MVNDTLDYIQIKSGIFKEHIDTFSLKVLTDEVFKLVEIQMEDKGLKQIVSISESL